MDENHKDNKDKTRPDPSMRIIKNFTPFGINNNIIIKYAHCSVFFFRVESPSAAFWSAIRVQAGSRLRPPPLAGAAVAQGSGFPPRIIACLVSQSTGVAAAAATSTSGGRSTCPDRRRSRGGVGQRFLPYRYDQTRSVL